MPLAALFALGLLTWALARFMPRKTVAGAEATAKWRAFKKYLEEIDQFEQLDAAQHLFERYLPYAIAFDIDKTWIEKFSRFGIPAPHWYGARGGTFSFPSGTDGLFGGPTLAPAGGSSSAPDLQSLSGKAELSLQAASNSLFHLFDSAGARFASGGGDSGIGGGGFGGGGFGGGGGGAGGFR
jgi:uncharacterized membrane protein YgcG